MKTKDESKGNITAKPEERSDEQIPAVSGCKQFERSIHGQPTKKRCYVINAQTPKSEKYMQEFGDFLGLDQIIYEDRGNGEQYTLVKDDRAWNINVSGNKYDGGFACFAECLK